MPPSTPVYPLLHLQLVTVVLALSEIEFNGQAEQTAEPIVFL